MKSTTPLSARWICPTNKPDLSGAVRKRRTGTAKIFTLLLLPYLTIANGPGKKPTPKNRKVIFVVMIVILTAAMGFLCLGGRRDDVMIEDFSVSADGSEMTLKAGIAGSAGYLRKVKVRYDDEHKIVLVDFYSTFGINNPVGAEDTFVIPLKPDSENILFNRGNDYYAALAKDADGRWYKFAR